jgi:hypothetical protein
LRVVNCQRRIQIENDNCDDEDEEEQDEAVIDAFVVKRQARRIKFARGHHKSLNYGNSWIAKVGKIIRIVAFAAEQNVEAESEGDEQN